MFVADTWQSFACHGTGFGLKTIAGENSQSLNFLYFQLLPNPQNGDYNNHTSQVYCSNQLMCSVQGRIRKKS